MFMSVRDSKPYTYIPNFSTFFGGLDKLIGEPGKDVEGSMRAEHCDITKGFGASDDVQVANNYHVEFTPKREWRFVTDPTFAEPMSAGWSDEDKETGRKRGNREKVRIEDLTQERLRTFFEQQGWDVAAVSEKLFKELNVTRPELIALRMYTGSLEPMPILMSAHTLSPFPLKTYHGGV